MDDRCIFFLTADTFLYLRESDKQNSFLKSSSPVDQHFIFCQKLTKFPTDYLARLAIGEVVKIGN